MTSVRF